MKATRGPGLDAKIERVLKNQSYGAKPTIEGVVLRDLRRFVDDAGDLQELGRLGPDGVHDLFPDFRVRQVLYTTLEPGGIKAWHLHRKQDDVWFVPPQDRLLVGLFDARKDGKTRDEPMRVVLGAGRSQLLFIPRGVAHGAANLYRRTMSTIYFVNEHFNATDPDERRLPWDHLGPDFWRLRPG